MADLPTHRSEQTGNPMLDRMQSNVRDLIAYVRNTQLAVPSYVQQTTDLTVAAGAYAKLFDVQIRKLQVGSRLAIRFGASFVQLTAAGGVSFQVKLDGVVVKGTYVTTPTATAAYNAGIVLVVAALPGLHTVTVEWKDSAGSVRVNAKSIVEEHATLLVEEIPS